LHYISFWKEEYGRIQELVQNVGIGVLSAQGSLKEYEKYREITHHADELLTILAEINNETPEIIEAGDFETLKRAIGRRLKDDAGRSSSGE
jgi:hypothetical protein